MNPKLLILPGMEEMGESILRNLQNDFGNIKAEVNRVDFSDGTSKIQILTGIRSSKLFILIDPYNYATTYTMRGQCYPMSPDMHMMSLLRTISAVEDDAEIIVIMPCLYAGRQHERNAREDLITAMVLSILEDYVKRIITYDIHSKAFDCTMTKKALYKFPTTKLLLEAYQHDNPNVNPEDMFALGTDEGALKRARKMASLIGSGCNFATCSKLRSEVKKGSDGYALDKHELFGRPELLKGKHVIITDDILDSGKSLVDVLKMLQDKGCVTVDLAISFGLFTGGLSKIQNAKDEGLFRNLYVTNLSYIPPEIKAISWIKVVDASLLISHTMKAMICDESLESFF